MIFFPVSNAWREGVDFKTGAYVNLHIVLSVPLNRIVQVTISGNRPVVWNCTYLLILGTIALHNVKCLHKCFFFFFLEFMLCCSTNTHSALALFFQHSQQTPGNISEPHNVAQSA